MAGVKEEASLVGTTISCEESSEVGTSGAMGWGRRQGKPLSTHWRHSDLILQVIRND